jgi:hypothetical protein
MAFISRRFSQMYTQIPQKRVMNLRNLREHLRNLRET